MPYQYDPNQDPNNQQQGGNTQLAGGSQVVGGSTQTAPAGSPASSGAPTHSDSFQNLNDYINANQGSGFGGQFSNKVNQDVNLAGQAQTNSANQFKGQVDSNTVQSNQDLLNQASSDPYSVASDPNKLSSFQSQENATYKGPSSLADTSGLYQQAQGATQKANNTANAAQSEAGRFSLLDSYYGNPNYNQGQKSLDNLLVQNDQTAQQGIKQAAANAQGYNQSFNQENTDLSNYAAQGRGTTEAAAKAAQNAIGYDPTTASFAPTSQYQTLLGSLNDQVKQDISGAAAQRAALTPNVNGYNQGGFYNINPDNYFSYVNPTVSNVATSDQRNKINALEQLAQITQTPFNDTSTPGYSFDKTGFNTAVGANQDAYRKAIDAVFMQQNGQNQSQLQQAIQQLNYQYGQPTNQWVSNLGPDSTQYPFDVNGNPKFRTTV